MPIAFPVARRTILLCDYASGGFREPEMVKRRPVVVVSPRLPHRVSLCTVVPLSGSEPLRSLPFVVRLELPEELPHPFPQRIWWAKCDMVATVAHDRLDLFRTARDLSGKRRYLQPKLPVAEFEAVLVGLLNGLGLGHLTLVAPRPHW